MIATMLLARKIYLCDIFLEAEYVWVKLKKSENVLKGFSFGIPQLLIAVILIQNVVVCFERGMSAWAYDRFIRLERNWR